MLMQRCGTDALIAMSNNEMQQECNEMQQEYNEMQQEYNVRHRRTDCNV